MVNIIFVFTLVVTVTMEAAFTSVSESSGNAVVFVKASGARTKQITVK